MRCTNTVTHMKQIHTQSFGRTFIVPLSPCCSGRIVGLTMFFVVSRENLSHFLGTSISIAPLSTGYIKGKKCVVEIRESPGIVSASFFRHVTTVWRITIRKETRCWLIWESPNRNSDRLYDRRLFRCIRMSFKSCIRNFTF